MVNFPVCLACLCLPLFFSLSDTRSCALVPGCVSSLHALCCTHVLSHTCCCVHTDHLLLLSGALAFPPPVCLLSLPYVLMSFPSVSLCLLLCLGLTLLLPVPLSHSILLALNQSFCPSAFPFHLPHLVPSIFSMYPFVHADLGSPHGIYMYYFAILRCFEVI